MLIIDKIRITGNKIMLLNFNLNLYKTTPLVVDIAGYNIFAVNLKDEDENDFDDDDDFYKEDDEDKGNPFEREPADDEIDDDDFPQAIPEDDLLDDDEDIPYN